MEDKLVKALNFLPEFKSCCFCVKNLKTAAIISSITLFILCNNIVTKLWSVMSLSKYHHWRSPVAIIHTIVFYIELVFGVAVCITNTIVFVTFCVDMRGCYGLLFVLLSLLEFPFTVLWIVIAGARAFFDPGVISIPTFNETKCPNATEEVWPDKKCFDESYKMDYVVFLGLLPLLFFIYLVVVIYSHFKKEMADRGAVWGGPYQAQYQAQYSAQYPGPPPPTPQPM